MIIDIVVLSLAALAALFSLINMLRGTKSTGNVADFEKYLQENSRNFDDIKQTLQKAMSELRSEITVSINQGMQTTTRMQAETQKQLSEAQIAAVRALQTTVADQLTLIERRMKNSNDAIETRLENIRNTMEARIASMQADNGKKLDEMRKTVDEQLQKTLETRLQKSFENVSKQLESVYKGLGEMQSLATGVGDLKKVLSNVKTRGILGEIQLGAILEQILTTEQYETNIATVPGSNDRVEFAVRLPGDGQTPVYLPIDAKFPMDAYNALMDAQQTQDKAQVDAAIKILQQRVKNFAKDIQNKYVHVPSTTEFAIMFLPTEGLYAEVVQHGMIEKLQADYKVIVAGPTTMAALLNSLQMGFKTLAIQKSSSEVWKVLGNVKSEFDTFGKVLEQTQNRINQANDELEKLVGVRTRQIQRKLSGVENHSLMESISEDEILNINN